MTAPARPRRIEGRRALRRLAVGALLAAGLSCAPGRADELVLQSGKKHSGYVREQGREVHLNVYGCSEPAMTLGVRRFRKLDVREIRPAPLRDHLHRRLAELGAADVERRLDLMRQAQSGRLVDEARRLAAEILAVRSTQPEALAEIGGVEKWAALRRGNPAMDRALALELRRLVRLESGTERKREAERLAKSFQYAPGADTIERMARSALADRGLQTDVPLRVNAEDFPGATYSLYVPAAYDATRAHPLLLALHGGGIMHLKGERTHGSAKDALAEFLDGAQALGWFVLCPTALEAPWPTSLNMAFLDAVMKEVTALWNVDLERIHVAGQGGGGDGAWSYAARRADLLASVAVAAAGKPVASRATAGKCAVWIYHGDADEVVPVDPVRKAAEGLLRAKADFVYCELPREGHGFAPAAKRDLYRYIAPKRRRRAKSAWPRSSFGEPSSAAAVRAFGDPAAAWGVGFDPAQPAAQLLGALAAGRTDAEPAARRLLAAHAGERAALAPAVRKLLGDPRAPRLARVWSAWLSGAWEDPDAVGPLGDTLRTAKDTLLLRHAAEAVGRIGSADSAQDLHWAVADVSARFLAIPGQTVPYQDFERACRLGAAVADAVGRVGAGDSTFFAELEEHFVRLLLMDRREIVANAENGEDPSGPRSDLTEALAHAYRRLGAEKTLFDMLRMAVRNDKQALQALLRGMRRPVR